MTNLDELLATDLDQIMSEGSERLRRLRDGKVRSASTVFERDGDHFSVRTVTYDGDSPEAGEGPEEEAAA